MKRLFSFFIYLLVVFALVGSIAFVVFFVESHPLNGIGFATYLIGCALAWTLISLLGKRVAKRLWPWDASVRSKSLQLAKQSFQSGFAALVTAAGYVHIFAPSLWQDSTWMLPMIFVAFAGAGFLGELLRSWLASRFGLPVPLSEFRRRAQASDVQDSS